MCILFSKQTILKLISFKKTLYMKKYKKGDNLIMDYFIHKGYLNLVEEYAKDLNVIIEIEPLFVRRSQIRNCIEKGDVEGCVNEINNLDPNLINTNLDINFYLILYKGYENAYMMHKNNIDDNKIIEIILYLKKHISNVSSRYFYELETFLEYLIFNSDDFKIESKRENLADKINILILKNYDIKENKLESIIKRIVTEENALAQKNKFTEFKNMITKI